MFYNSQTEQQQEDYRTFLKVVGSLSNLSSDSKVPYLYYRMAEKIFCRAFDVEDLSRSDVSVDAKKNFTGIGLKTFLANNNKTFQKVAEFNANSHLLKGLSPESMAIKVAELRNDRISFDEKLYNIESSIYHCVVREENKFKIFEKPMQLINLDSIDNIVQKGNTILFNDGREEYSFSISKSTLSKRFETSEFIDSFDVEIIEDPLKILRACLDKKYSPILIPQQSIISSVYLPLYGSDYKVYKKSGLNQWNAFGRARNSDEVYIPIPAKIHKLFPDFFPSRDVTFSLKFPDGERVDAKVCQDGRKALMTNPNKKLGKLILRDGLKLKEGELATYQKLQDFGIDSVRIDKIKELEYEIFFSKNGSYDEFITENQR